MDFSKCCKQFVCLGSNVYVIVYVFSWISVIPQTATLAFLFHYGFSPRPFGSPTQDSVVAKHVATMICRVVTEFQN